MSKNTSTKVTEITISSSDMAKLEKLLTSCEKAAQTAIDEASSVRKLLDSLKAKETSVKKDDKKKKSKKEESSEEEKSEVEKLDVSKIKVMKKDDVLAHLKDRGVKHDKKDLLKDLRELLTKAVEKEEKKTSKSSESKKKVSEVETTEEEPVKSKKSKGNDKSTEKSTSSKKQQKEHVLTPYEKKGYALDEYGFVYTLSNKPIIVARMDKKKQEYKPLTETDIKEIKKLNLSNASYEKKTLAEIKKVLVPKIISKKATKSTTETTAETTESGDDASSIHTSEEDEEGGGQTSTSTSSSSSEEDKEYDDDTVEGTEKSVEKKVEKKPSKIEKKVEEVEDQEDEAKEINKHFNVDDITEEDFQKFIDGLKSGKVDFSEKREVNAKNVGMNEDKFGMIMTKLEVYKKKWPKIYESYEKSKDNKESTEEAPTRKQTKPNPNKNNKK